MAEVRTAGAVIALLRSVPDVRYRLTSIHLWQMALVVTWWRGHR